MDSTWPGVFVSNCGCCSLTAVRPFRHRYWKNFCVKLNNNNNNQRQCVNGVKRTFLTNGLSLTSGRFSIPNSSWSVVLHKLDVAGRKLATTEFSVKKKLLNTEPTQKRTHSLLFFLMEASELDKLLATDEEQHDSSLEKPFSRKTYVQDPFLPVVSPFGETYVEELSNPGLTAPAPPRLERVNLSQPSLTLSLFSSLVADLRSRIKALASISS